MNSAGGKAERQGWPQGLIPSTAHILQNPKRATDFSFRLRQHFQNRNRQQGWVLLGFILVFSSTDRLVPSSTLVYDLCSVSRWDSWANNVWISRRIPLLPGNPLIVWKQKYSGSFWVEIATHIVGITENYHGDVVVYTPKQTVTVCHVFAPRSLPWVFHILYHPVILLRWKISSVTRPCYCMFRKTPWKIHGTRDLKKWDDGCDEMIPGTTHHKYANQDRCLWRLNSQRKTSTSHFKPVKSHKTRIFQKKGSLALRKTRIWHPREEKLSSSSLGITLVFKKA